MELNPQQFAICKIIRDAKHKGIEHPVPSKPRGPIKANSKHTLVPELVIWAELYPKSNRLEEVLNELEDCGVLESFDRPPASLTFLRSDGKTVRITQDKDKDSTVRVAIEGVPGGSLRIDQYRPFLPHWKLTQLGAQMLASAPTDEKSKTTSKNVRKKKQGRQRGTSTTNIKQDEQLAIAWKSGQYPKYEALADAFGITKLDVKQALDRHRKRQH